MTELDRRFRKEKEREDYGESWPEVRSWLHRQELVRRDAAPRPSLAIFWPAGAPARLAVAVLTAAVLVVGCTWPVQQQELIGYLLRMPVTTGRTDAQRAISRLPWAGEVMVFATESRAPGATTLMLVAPRTSAAEVERWAHQLDSLPGIGTPRVEALRERVTRPAYAAATHSLLGLSLFGMGELSDEEARNHLYARVGEIQGTFVHLEWTDTARGTSAAALFSQPDDSTATPISVFTPDSAEIRLVVVGIHPDGRVDTLQIPLDTTGFAGGTDAERTARVREALRARGFAHRVEVAIQNGSVQVRALPRP